MVAMFIDGEKEGSSVQGAKYLYRGAGLRMTRGVPPGANFWGASGFMGITILKHWVVRVIDPTRSPKTDFL